MRSTEECCDSSARTLRLTGSQINLTSRSDQTVSGSTCNRKLRGCFSAHSCRGQICRRDDLRPKSADYGRQALHHPPSQCFGDSSLTVSHFTDSSSKLLQNLLLACSSTSIPIFEDRFPGKDMLSLGSSKSKSEISVEDKKFETGNVGEFLMTDHLSFDSKFQKDLTLQVDENSDKASVKTVDPETVEEKTVRFYEGQQIKLPENKFTESYTSFRNSANVYSCLKNNFKHSFHEPGICQALKKTSSEASLINLDSKMTIHVNDQSDKLKNNKSVKLKNFNSDNEDDIPQKTPEEQYEEENVQEKCRSPQKDTYKRKLGHLAENSGEEPRLPVFHPNLDLDNTCSKQNPIEKFDRLSDISDEEIHEEIEALNEADEDDIKHDCTEKIDSTYEEIVHLLQTLDEEDSDNMNSDIKKASDGENPAEKASSEEKIDYLSAVSSYLEEMERDDGNVHENYTNTEKYFNSPRLEELLNKNSVELAHEVFSLKIQVEDQKKGIKLLKDTLAEQKEARKILELEHQEELHKVSSEAETLVQRHQKFIKQLLNEKKNLNETVSKLVQDLKTGEDRYKRNIKAMEEKHLIEIKRAKEMQAASDKIKREKWMEIKTQKIKEMTVKGLEPELSRMALRQQEELTELRNLQKAELEAVELRAARRTSELMDELRAELTKEKERAISKETASLRASMEKEFEDERNKLQQYCQSLKDRIRKQEEKFSNQEFEFQQRIMDFRQDEEKKRQKIIRERQEDLEEVRRQHLVELKNLKESLEAEKEAFVNNYKKQQASKLLEREAELHQQYKKERDREIELIIETLEKESSQIQKELNAACEGKLKRLKDKMEEEIKEMSANEEALKIKLSNAKSKLSEKEDSITELNSQIRQLQTELTFFKKSCEEMSLEKTKLREVVRGEFESSISSLIKEKENLEKEILVIKELHSKELAKKDQLNIQAKCEMQKELTRVYSRIKTAVNKKEKIIESLREENGATNQRCRELEFMLDQQRRNLLLQERTSELDRAETKEWGGRRRNGIAPQEARRRMEKDKDIVEHLRRRDRGIQRQEQYNRIQLSRYNPEYKKCLDVELPQYLRKNSRKRHKEGITG